MPKNDEKKEQKFQDITNILFAEKESPKDVPALTEKMLANQKSSKLKDSKKSKILPKSVKNVIKKVINVVTGKKTEDKFNLKDDEVKKSVATEKKKGFVEKLKNKLPDRLRSKGRS